MDVLCSTQSAAHRRIYRADHPVQSFGPTGLKRDTTWYSPGDSPTTGVEARTPLTYPVAYTIEVAPVALMAYFAWARGRTTTMVVAEPTWL